MKLQFSIAVLVAMLLANSLSADLITYKFTGEFPASSLLFNAGDTYSGSYTFSTESNIIPHPDSTLTVQTSAGNPSIAGTGWRMAIQSSVVAPFELTGQYVSLAVGNNTAFGDRYSATLFDPAVTLPLGLDFNLFQIDLQDRTAQGADMVNSDNPFQLPNLTNAAVSHGNRFFIIDPPSGCSQCHTVLTSLTVPEPTSAGLIVALGFGVAIQRRRRFE